MTDVRDMASGLRRAHGRRARIWALLAAASCVVALCVAWSLKLTGISMTGDAYCGLEEHEHTKACYERVLVCGQQETPAHHHSREAGCYEDVRALACGLEEHVHSHEDGCYDEDGNLVCTRAEHTHSDACYETSERLVCETPEGEGHQHSDACYEQKLVCCKEEHVHTLACYSDAQADLETSDLWEQTIPALTGDAGQDVAATALAQLGYEESAANYQVDADGAIRRGYTRYGAWYGLPYEDWGALFADFCLSYGHSPYADALSSVGVAGMLSQARQAGLVPDDAYVPRPGDLAFADADSDGVADVVGVVCDVDDATGAVRVVTGDSDMASSGVDRVEERELSLSDPAVVAYARLSGDDSGDVEETGEAEAPSAPEAASSDRDQASATDARDESESSADASEGEVLDGGASQKDGEAPLEPAASSARDATSAPEGASASVTDDALSSDEFLQASPVGDASVLAGTAVLSDAHAPVSATVSCYAYVDGATRLMGTRTTTWRWIEASGRGRYYTPAADVIDAYASLGLDLQDFATLGPRLLANAEHGDATLWNDVDAVQVDGSWYIPALPANKAYKAAIDYYYLPVSYATLTTSAAVSSLASSDGFWSVTTIDPNHVAYAADAVPGVRYVLTGHDVTLTLAAPAGAVSWLARPWADESATPVAGSAGTDGTVSLALTGVSAPYVVYPSDVTPSRPATKVGYVNLYAFVDGERTLVDRRQMTWTLIGNRYYLAAGDLEDVYGAFGFRRAVIAAAGGKTYVFPNAQQGEEKIWGDADCVLSGGQWYVPVLGKAQASAATPTVDLYYAPVSGASGKITKSYKEFLDSADTFWSISVQDPDHEAYAAADLPAPTYVLAGGSAEVVVNDPSDGRTWAARPALSSEAGSAGESLGDGRTRFSFSDVRAAQVIALTGAANLTPTTTRTVNCYAFIDGARTLVRTLELPWYKFDTTYQAPYYLDVNDLEGVYGYLGFSAAEVTGPDVRLFPHTETGSATIWADKGPVEKLGKWYTPIIYKEQASVDVYYTPNAGLTFASGSTSGAWASFQTSDSFWTVRVADPDGFVYAAGEIPPTQYLLAGGAATARVKTAPTGHEWLCYDVGAGRFVNVTGQTDGDTLTFTFQNVSSSYLLIPSKSTIKVKYTVPDTGWTEDLGMGSSDGRAQDQEPVESTPTVCGSTVYTDVLTLEEDASLTVQDISRTTWKVRLPLTNKGYRLFTYSFMGWRVGAASDEATYLQPGQTIGLASVWNVLDAGELDLTADWSIKERDDSGNVMGQNTAGFYVNVYTSISNTEGNTGSTSQGLFSDALFTTAVRGGGQFAAAVRDNKLGTDADGSRTKSFIVGDSSTSAYEVDERIRQLAQGVTSNVNGTDYGPVSFDEFPSDTQIFDMLKTWGQRSEHYDHNYIKMDDAYIPLSELNTTDYAIRWYAVKCENSDGWHVDGIVVPKKAQLVVTKMFVGDAEAISAVKDSGAFDVLVTRKTDGAKTKLVLKPASEVTAAGEQGYYYHDVDRDMYAWLLDVRQNTDYTVAEENYEPADGQTTVSSTYAIDNSPDSTGGFRQYAGSTNITVTGHAYAADLPVGAYQVVSFRNTYLKEGTLALRKRDVASGMYMAGVTFALTGADGSALDLWQSVSSPSNYYLQKPLDVDAADLREVTDGMVTTGAQGELFLHHTTLDASSFTITEQALTGYDPADPIRVTIDKTGYTSIEGTDGDFDIAEAQAARSLSSSLIVNNRPRTVSVTASKNWVDDAESDYPAVRVQLFANGIPMSSADGVSYIQELSEANDWTYTWNDLPLYEDGSPVAYSLREVKIGSTPYSAGDDSSDGYADYVVTYDPAVYAYGDGSTQAASADVPLASLARREDGSYATSVLLTVNNASETVRLLVQKVDDADTPSPVAGAEFSLERREAVLNETTHLMEVQWVPYRIGRTYYFTTDAAGRIQLWGDVVQGLPGGTYRLTETSAPVGYEALTTPIEFTVRGGKVALTDAESAAWRLEGTSAEPRLVIVDARGGAELPALGGPGPVPVMLAGGALAALSACLIARKGRARDTRGGDAS